MTATVTDPDGEVTNVIYQWTSGPTKDTADVEDIDGATSATYTPTAGDPADEDDTGDIGNFLRVEVFYNDPQGPDDTDTANEDRGSARGGGRIEECRARAARDERRPRVHREGR